MVAKIKKPPAAKWVDAVGAYLENVKLRRSEHTWVNYRSDLADFAAWYDGHNDPPLTLVGDVTAVDLLAWQKAIESRPGREFKDKPQGTTMPATINRKLAAVHSFLKWAASMGYVPGAAERPDMAERQALAPRWLDEKEQHRLKKALEMKGEKLHRGLILFDMHTGLRCAELAALLWSDITIGERKGKATVRRGKGSKLRDVPLGFEARRALELVGSPGLVGTQGAVFVGRHGGLSERGIRFIVEGYANLARLPDLTCHVLRHTFAKNFLRDGGTLEQLARILGHEDMNTTRIYVEASLQELQDVVEEMGRRKRA
jgi:site-specific recombinase XerD